MLDLNVKRQAISALAENIGAIAVPASSMPMVLSVKCFVEMIYKTCTP